MKRKVLSLALILTASIAFIGCGSGDSSSGIEKSKNFNKAKKLILDSEDKKIANKMLRWNESSIGYLGNDKKLYTYMTYGDNFIKYSEMDGTWDAEPKDGTFHINFSDGEIWNYKINKSDNGLVESVSFVNSDSGLETRKTTHKITESPKTLIDKVTKDKQVATEQKKKSSLVFSNSMLSSTTWLVKDNEGSSSNIKFNSDKSVNNDGGITGMGSDIQDMRWSTSSGRLVITRYLFGMQQNHYTYRVSNVDTEGCYHVSGNDSHSGWTASYTMCKK